MWECKYDPYSPCEECGRCGRNATQDDYEDDPDRDYELARDRDEL